MQPDDGAVTQLSAVTLATHDMGRAVRFYTALGFAVAHGGETADFTSLRAGTGFLNLVAQPPERRWSWWGRVIVHVPDVDDAYRRCLALGAATEAPPRDAEWGERYFHVRDPDGHEVSLARPLDDRS
jgi:catechol 2,3-dioxygenase-like lactoylglutathione lyase family enzyme